MCGIAGILRFDDEPIDPRRAQAMRDALRHRGPDGDGIAQLGRCTLVHTRLAVIDQHDGAQPMSLPDGSLSVTFNGEIYNHADLREQLERLGHTFTTDHSDTEVLLHGYRHWGTKLMDRLDGMWAFAIWDAAKQALLLSRDRAGQKPLYVCRIGDFELLFASEYAALSPAVNTNKQLEDEAWLGQQARIQFLRLGYTFNSSADGTACEVSKNSWEKPRGGYTEKILQGDYSGCKPSRYGRYKCAKELLLSDQGTPAEQVETILSESVRRRLVSDVPLGAFLSAGIDSSLVSLLAQKQLKQAGLPPLQTFSVAMDVAVYDESVEAAETARFLGTNHTTLSIKPGDVMDDLEHLMGLTGEPTADSSILPTYWLCKAAREHVTVAISGDGGDELFGGYNRYRAMDLLAKQGWWLRSLPATNHVEQRNIRARFGRLVRSARLRKPAKQFLSMIELFDDEQMQQLHPNPGKNKLTWDWCNGVPGWPKTTDTVRNAMAWDRHYYLPYDILRKVDRASMAVALEVRCPMLSPGMLALSERLKTDQIRMGGRPKGLLRELAKKYLPPAVAKRRKSGFAIPIGQWFRTTLADAMRERVLDSGYMRRLDLKPDLPEQMCKEHIAGVVDHSHRLFALLQLSIWSQWLKSQSDAKQRDHASR